MIFIFILTYILTVFGQPNKFLRGFFEKEKKRVIQHLIDKEYEYIKLNVYRQAMMGKIDLQFTILCEPAHVKYNMYENNLLFENIRHENYVDRAIQIYKITNEQISPKVVNMLQKEFPDTQIITEKDNTIYNPNKCVHYTISW